MKNVERNFLNLKQLSAASVDYYILQLLLGKYSEVTQSSIEVLLKI